MHCEDVVRYLSDYIDNALDGALMAEAREHLATCRNCHVVLESTQQTILLYRERGKRLAMPPARHAVLFQHLREALTNAPAEDCADASSAASDG